LLVRPDRLTIALALAAFVLTLAFAAYLSPDWPARDDQRQYVALAHALAERGQFTRALAGEPFIPESLRFPGYPLFLAPLCAVGCSPWLVAVVQGVVLAALVILVARYAVSMLDRRGTRIATVLVALHPAFAFFAAYTLSDLLGTAVAFTAIVVTVHARPSSVGRAFAVGALAAATVLVRPFLVFMPAIAGLAVLRRDGARALTRPLLIALAVFVVALAPYVAYVESAFGRPVVGSTGAQLWLGYFQGLDPASLDATERVEADAGRAALDRFDATTDRVTQAYAFVALDDELRTRSLRLIAHDPLGWAARGITRSVVLWAGDPPLRPEHISAATTAIWVVVNVLCLVVGIAGAWRLAARGDATWAVPLLVIVVTWAFSFPLWAEGRFALPARPFLAVGMGAFFTLSRRRDG